MQIPDAMFAALPAAQRQRPWIRLLRAARELQRGAADAALPALAALVEELEDDAVGTTWVRLRLADAALALGDIEGCEAHLDALPAELPGDGARVAVEVNRSWIAFMRGSPAAACAHLDRAVDLALSGGDPSARTALGQGLSVTQLLAHPDPAALERRLLALDIDAPGPFAASGGLRGRRRGGAASRPRHRDRQARGGAPRRGSARWTGVDGCRDRSARTAPRPRASATTAPRRRSWTVPATPCAAARSTPSCGSPTRPAWRARRGIGGIAPTRARPAWRSPESRRRATSSRAFAGARACVALAQRGRGEPDAAERTLRAALEAPPDPPLLVVAEPVAELAGLFLEQQREREAAALALPWLRELARTGRLGLVLGFGRQGQTLLELAARSGEPVLTGAAALVLRAAGAATRPRAVEVQGVRISARELEVLRLLARGASNGAIAAELVIAERTVKSHVASLMRKLDARSRTHAVARARELGLV